VNATVVMNNMMFHLVMVDAETAATVATAVSTLIVKPVAIRQTVIPERHIATNATNRLVLSNADKK